MNFLIALILLFTPVAHAQVSGNLWTVSANYLKPVLSTWGLQIPSLANQGCIGTDATGKFQAGTCTGGGASFPFTPQSWGNSTSTTIGFTQGIISNASSTFSYLGTGALFSQNGLILSDATTSASVAYQDVWRDANQNAFAQNFISAATVFPSAGTVNTLTAASPRTWVITGTKSQGLKLPVGTTLGNGTTYVTNNNSTGTTTFYDAGSNQINGNILPGGAAEAVLYDNSTSNGSWDVHSWLGHNVLSGSNNLSVGTTTPWASLAIHANPTDAVLYNTLFAIGSSTSAATSTLFSINNQGNVLITGSTTVGSVFQGGGLTTCTGTSALTYNGTAFTCTAQPQGTVTSVTATSPILSSGGATPNITFTGLATTSSPTQGQLLFSSANATYGIGTGVAGVSTTSATINNGLSGTLTTLGSGQTIGLASISAGVLGNASAASAVPTSQATSTLYGIATPGQVLGFTNGGIGWVSTTSSSGGSVGNWFVADAYGAEAVNATGTPLWLKSTTQYGLIASSTFATFASSTVLSSGNIYDTALSSTFVPYATTGGLLQNTRFIYSNAGGTPVLTVGVAGADQGQVAISGATSGTTALAVRAAASGTLTLPSLTGNPIVGTVIDKGIYSGLGTTTPNWLLQLATSTAPQLTLSDGSLTSVHWTQRNINGNLYLATASPATFATSSVPALSINSGAYQGLVGLGTSTPFARFAVDTTNAVSGWVFAVGSSVQNFIHTTWGGQTTTCETKVATSSVTTIDWEGSCNKVIVGLGGSAMTIQFKNATTSKEAGGQKVIVVTNPTGTAGAVTWKDIEWAGATVPTQTTTANQADVYSVFVTSATSTTNGTTASYKMFGAASTGFQ